MTDRARRLIHDPGHGALHRAARVIIVSGGLFVFGREVLDNDQFAVFGLFGGFAMLGFGDFGGAAWARIRSYLSVTLIGARVGGWLVAGGVVDSGGTGGVAGWSA